MKIFLAVLLCLVLTGQPLAMVQTDPVMQEVVVSAPSDPSTIFTGGTLRRWYRADSTVCGGVACADTNSIDTFTDGAGIGNATFNTGTRAVYAASVAAINNMPAANSGTADALYDIGGTTYTPGAGGFTAFAVINVNNYSAQRAIFGGASGGAPEYRIDYSYENYHQQLLSEITASIGLNTSILAAATWYKVAFTYQSGATPALTFYTNSDSTDGTANSSTTFSQPIARFFGAGASGERFQGYIAEVVIVDGVASSGQITAMMGSTGYFNTRYGL